MPRFERPSGTDVPAPRVRRNRLGHGPAHRDGRRHALYALFLAHRQREHKASCSFERQVHTMLRSSYLGHCRRMLPAVLGVLESRSNNAVHRPVLDAYLKRLACL